MEKRAATASERQFDLRIWAMFLMTEFERPERVQSVWESMTAQLMDYGLDWRKAPGLRVFDYVLRGDYEAAIPSMLEMNRFHATGRGRAAPEIHRGR